MKNVKRLIQAIDDGIYFTTYDGEPIDTELVAYLEMLQHVRGRLVKYMINRDGAL